MLFHCALDPRVLHFGPFLRSDILISSSEELSGAVKSRGDGTGRSSLDHLLFLIAAESHLRAVGTPSVFLVPRIQLKKV